MALPIVTPRAEKIANDLLSDAQQFLEAEDCGLSSRQIVALAKAVARHLAALEDLMMTKWLERRSLLEDNEPS